MFGRRKRKHDEEDVAVDATLELDLGTVEESVEAYLQGPSDERRKALLAVLAAPGPTPRRQRCL